MNCLDSPTEIFVVAWLAFTILSRLLKAAQRRAPAEPAAETPPDRPHPAGGTAASDESEAPQIPEAVRRWLESVGIDVGDAAGESGSRPPLEQPADAGLEATSPEFVAEDTFTEGAGAETDDGEPEPAWSDRAERSEEAGGWTDARESELAFAYEPRVDAGASEGEVIETEEIGAPPATVLGAGSTRTVVAVAPATLPNAAPAALVRDALVLDAILTPRRWRAPPPARRREYGR